MTGWVQRCQVTASMTTNSARSAAAAIPSLMPSAASSLSSLSLKREHHIENYNKDMARFADLTVAQFLDALASPDPTPGGGTAAAVAGAIGVSLLTMVAGLTKTRQQTEAA